MTVKASFSHKIDDSFADLFEKLCNQLGPPKYRILEAAIEVFASLPRNIQYRLRGLDHAERKPILEKLSRIDVEDETQQREAESSVSECIETFRGISDRYEIPDKEQALLITSLRKLLGPERKGGRADAVEDDAAALRQLDKKKHSRRHNRPAESA